MAKKVNTKPKDIKIIECSECSDRFLKIDGVPIRTARPVVGMTSKDRHGQPLREACPKHPRPID